MVTRIPQVVAAFGVASRQKARDRELNFAARQPMRAPIHTDARDTGANVANRAARPEWFAEAIASCRLADFARGLKTSFIARALDEEVL
jgi:hypothetical protein